MASCPPQRREYLRHLFDATKNGQHQQPFANRYWRQWASFAINIGQHPFLPKSQADADYLEQIVLFLAFAVALREGRFHDGKKASGASIKTSICECAQCMVSYGLKDPRKQTPGSAQLDPSISSYIKQCKKEDPAPQPQQALPNSTVKWIAKTFHNHVNKHLHIASHLIVVAFFFLLRVGEYTASSDIRQTIPLRKRDIKLYKNNRVISNESDLSTLLAAEDASICIENQKNGQKNAILSHSKSKIPGFCPVESLAYLIHEIKHLQDDTLIGTY